MRPENSLAQRAPGSLAMRDGHAFALGHVATLPVCNASCRGDKRCIRGGTGVADREVVCQKVAADTYAWIDIGVYGQGIGLLADPNVDKILFWDDSAGAYAYLGMGTAISISGTTLNVATTTPTVTALYTIPSVSTAVASTANETVFDRFYTVLANTMVAGDQLRLRAWGTHADTSGSTFTTNWRLRWGGVGGVILGVMPSDLTGGLTTRWQVESHIAFTAVGGSGVVEVTGRFQFAQTASLASGWSDTPWLPTTAGTAVSVATNADKDLVVTCDHSGSSANTTATMRGYSVERLRP